MHYRSRGCYSPGYQGSLGFRSQCQPNQVSKCTLEWQRCTHRDPSNPGHRGQGSQEPRTGSPYNQAQRCTRTCPHCQRCGRGYCTRRCTQHQHNQDHTCRIRNCVASLFQRRRASCNPRPSKDHGNLGKQVCQACNYRNHDQSSWGYRHSLASHILVPASLVHTHKWHRQSCTRHDPSTAGRASCDRRRSSHTRQALPPPRGDKARCRGNLEYHTFHPSSRTRSRIRTSSSLRR